MKREIKGSSLADSIGWINAVLGLGLLSLSTHTQAVPSFARQTGMACSHCHVTSFGPRLTPAGRDFKLNGYVSGENESALPPVSGMVMGSFTHTQKNQAPPGPSYSANSNFVFDQASLFLAGRIWDKLGVFSQLTYDGLADRVDLDNTDLRFADQIQLAGQDIVYGISANNNPTVQDLWNTTPAWGFPYVASPYAATPTATTLIDGGLGIGQVGGATLYTMINNLLYVEAGAYTTMAKNFQKAMGNWSPDQSRIDGGAPYWRIALQHDFGPHYVQVGHYALRANVFPAGLDHRFGTDRYTDLAADATYQYLGNIAHIFELKTTYIRETQELFATHGSGGSAVTDNQLNTFKINAAYTYEQTYSLTFAYNRTRGTKNLSLYSGFSPNGKPDSEYFTVELDYVPFGKTGSFLRPWLNLRLGLQYVAYTQFDGLTSHAGDNNTLLVNGWLAF